MFEALKKLFRGNPVDYTQLIREGAAIVDVRTSIEYASGHIKGSLNIPVDKLSQSLGRLKDKKKPVITCCASGMRSATAKSILQSNGYEKVYNGGAWHRLNMKIQ